MAKFKVTPYVHFSLKYKAKKNVLSLRKVFS